MSSEPSSRPPRTDYPDQVPGSGDGSQRPARARRVRLACLRCQTRKIKCDGNIPQCSGCRRAGAQCIDGKKTIQEGSISRSEAATLYRHIQRLEGALQAQCPHLDLGLVVADGDLPPPPREVAAASTHSTNLSRHRDVEPASVDETSRNNLRERPNLSGGSSPPRNPSRNEIAHEIGLIPLSAGISKYVGPSSGLSFAKLVFARADLSGSHVPGSIQNSTTHESPSTTSSRSMFMIEPAPIPKSLEQAIQLSKIYFEHIHVQYPFLHGGTFSRQLHDLYSNPEGASRVVWFQVTMVLAISASILSKRLRIPFSGEGLATSAMQYTDEIDFQNSTEGVQCLLLLSMFTLHSPFLRLNPWYLNYQCLAAVLDLGLQRDVPISPSIGPLEREMRTRLFWVIYSIDRTLATTLGRPIGLRDEACDLRRT
ncbi:Fungal Zn2-Cys6 binuclear cluster domain-containing protein [Cladophialophora immunda]|nr:Fungal Zn2-Cys6 binuclear cluster domain-containing protein [Cladophialophora immunda]